MLRADAIIVLGCRILPSGRPTAAAGRRIATAASAFQQGVAPIVVAAGGRRWGSLVEARVFAEELARAGVPEGAVVRELCSLTTHENAIFSAATLRRLGGSRAAVVTCPWHLPRAIADFRRAGVDAIPLPALPSESSRITAAQRWIHESVSRWLDARAMERGSLYESARSHGGGLARSRPARAEGTTREIEDHT
jgi:uncharacterized SAM-binding protein YcdF (DUF218 family)